MLIVVGEPLHDLSPWGDFVVLPPVVVDPLVAYRRRAAHLASIRLAMANAVEAANPGDVILQNDMRLVGDPYAGDEVDGVRVLSGSIGRHVCPRAFVAYTQDVLDRVRDLWRDATEGQACNVWSPVPKVLDYCVAIHDRSST